MLSPSQVIKNQGSTAKRSATALVSLSKDSELSPADAGLLLKAAEVLTSLSNRKAKEAKRKKAEEDAYQKARAIAGKEATALMAQWQFNTTLDQVALILLRGYRYEYLNKALAESPKKCASDLAYWFGEARRDVADDVAYAAATKRQSVADGIEIARAKHEISRMLDKTILIATRIDAAIKLQQAAA